MKRLRIYMALFALGLALPLAFVTLRTLQGLDREETARMRFFAETLLADMEQSLAALVEREEGRAVDEYRHTRMSPDDAGASLSPLAAPPAEPFLLGYLQNNPDGSFQTPLVEDAAQAPPELRDRVAQLSRVNRVFNRKKSAPPLPHRAPPAAKAWDRAEAAAPTQGEADGFAGRFLDLEERQAPRERLGYREKRQEAVTASQVRNLTQELETPGKRETSPVAAGTPAASPADAGGPAAPRPFQVEVAPLQSVFIDPELVFVFRRILIAERVYRQGFVLRLPLWLEHIAETHFAAQPMAGFARLELGVRAAGAWETAVSAGVAVPEARFALEHTFPAPFDFLSARIASAAVPPVPARRTLLLMLGLLAMVVAIGLAAIHRSAATVVEWSERRARFVASVTHELKTPLTNIRLYVEMLEQGLGADAGRREAYLRIVAAESARLSRLIGNVLELSRLEQGRKPLQTVAGDLEDAIGEARDIMAPRLAQEGFTLTVERSPIPPALYDREMVVQLLVNLMENSLKFGRGGEVRRLTLRVRPAESRVEVSLEDTGPGIPPRDLKKIFDDFYRVEGPLVRTSAGTGIGLALVRRYARAMGASVRAQNNAGPGCTITISLPRAAAG